VKISNKVETPIRITCSGVKFKNGEIPQRILADSAHTAKWKSASGHGQQRDTGETGHWALGTRRGGDRLCVSQ